MDNKQWTKLIGISSLILLFVFSSCKDESKKDEPTKSIRNYVKQKKAEILIKFDFPDTVYINKSYDGRIEYKSILDTITTNVLEEKNGKNRYVIFSLTKTNNINYNTKQLKKVKLDTFGAISNRVIPFSGIKFTNLGTNYIDGIINDQAIIANSLKEKKADDKVRIIENETRATHKVVVIERP